MLVAPRHSPGHLAENVMHFARVLRSAGIAVGTDRVQLARQALRVAGFDGGPDSQAWPWACLLGAGWHNQCLDQAVEWVWRDPYRGGRRRGLMLPELRAEQALVPEARGNRGVRDALCR